MALILFFIACESDSIIVDSSFTENNSLFSISFPLNSLPEDTNTFQDSLHSNGDSYRLYAGEIDSYIDNSDFITSEILFKINLDDFRESKYCNLDNTNLSDSTIESIDSIKMIFRTFTQLMDEDSLLKLNIDDLEIIGAFSIDSELHPDSILLYSKISDFNLEEDEFVSIINSAQSNIEFEEYMIKLGIPIPNTAFDVDNENNIDLCNEDGHFFILFRYNPSDNGEIQYIELTSSQYSTGFSTLFRPSFEIAYNEFNLNTEYIDKFLISSISSLGNNNITDDNIYFVTNDTLTTNSNIMIFPNVYPGLQDSINLDETYLYDIAMNQEYIEATTSENPYKLDILLELNQEFEDSINIIDIIIDAIVIAPNLNDPVGDNHPNGFELNGQYDSTDDSTEIFYDLGLDYCPNLYESGDGESCLCDFILNPEGCDDIENLIYNLMGTEGNGIVDLNETFPESQDVGSDGCSDEFETGLDYDGNSDCLTYIDSNYIPGSDPNEDNYLLDPSQDDWLDCGVDKLCDKDEPGYDSENNPDPHNDNWGSNNFEGTEANGVWDNNEGTEGNGLYDYGESFNDFGINGLPQEEEEACVDCISDGLTEGNEIYDLGEPFQDSGIDGLFSINEDGYNPNGTEGNGMLDENEIFPPEYDCGSDALCNIDEDGYEESNLDPNLDDYNIDPNDDNWNDCGIDANCDIIDEDGTQDNDQWDENENFENNSQYDIGEHFYDWGFDQTPDSLEMLLSDYTLTYSAPQTISYELDQELILNNDFDASRDIIFDIERIVPHETIPNSIIIGLNIYANEAFTAMQFRLNHSPILYQSTTLEHYEESLYSINDNKLIEDVSLYENRFDDHDFQNDTTLTVDYMNAIKFRLDFNALDEFVINHPGAHINKNYTRLALYIDHENINHNFFDGSVNLWLNTGEQNRFLYSFTASSNSEILVPFGSVIEDLVDGDIDLSHEMVFLLDGVYNNTSRIVFYRNAFPPVLEVFYSE